MEDKKKTESIIVILSVIVVLLVSALVYVLFFNNKREKIKINDNVPTEEKNNDDKRIIYKKGNDTLELMMLPTKEFEEKVKEAYAEQFSEGLTECKKNLEECRNELFKNGVSEYLKKETHIYYGIYNGKPIYIEEKINENENYISLSGNPIRFYFGGQGYGYNFLINKNSKTIEMFKEGREIGIINLDGSYFFTDGSSVLAGKNVYTKDLNRLGILIEEKSYSNNIYVLDAKFYNDENVAIKKYDKNGKLVSTSEKFKYVNPLSSIYTNNSLYVLIIDNNTLYLYGVDSKEKIEIARNTENFETNVELSELTNKVINIRYDNKIYTYDISSKKLTSN